MEKWFVLVAVFSLSYLSEARPVRTESIPDEKNDFLQLGYSAPPLTNALELGVLDLSFGRSDFKPWNSSYWPTYKGIGATRYNDPSFPDDDNWITNYSHFLNRPPTSYLNGQINMLSPAEKYDLLIGDASWGVTNKMWGKGQAVMNTYGRVPKWFGFCHGWNGAAHTGIPEPLFPVTVLAADGIHQITFYPQDIKALLTWLWAESAPSTNFVGQRCRVGSADRDEFGRIKDPACFDSNPKTWHLAILNRVGKDKQSFVMDVEAKPEVWNYAVDSYYLRYFNVRTLKPHRFPEEAIVPRESFFSDPYKNFRAPESTHILGVVMVVFFPKAIVPTSHSSSGERLFDQKTFVYDLELDAQSNIIGGEWHSEDRPDFIWSFPFGSQARTPEDLRVSEPWILGEALPLTWSELGQESSKKGKILASVVNTLLEQSLLSIEEAAPVTPALANVAQ